MTTVRQLFTDISTALADITVKAPQALVALQSLVTFLTTSV